MIDKIRKLLALSSNNPNQEEAARAMEKAQALMLKHGIEQSELGEQKPGIVYGEKHEFNDWEQFVASAAAEVSGTRPLFWRQAGYMKFLGREDNVKASAMMYHFLCDQIEKLYKISLPKGMTQKERAMYRKSFKLGAAHIVYQRAAEIAKNAHVEGMSTALVCLHMETLKNEVDDFISENVNLAKPRATKPKKVNGDAFHKGIAAGKTVRINQGVK